MRAKKYVLIVLCLTLLCFGAVGIASTAKLQTHKNSIGMEFVLIPAGSFMMGTDHNAEIAERDEIPQHSVTISKPFYLGKYEVTQAQWEAVMGSNPSLFKGPNNPVEQVSWDDAQEFIKRLNFKEGHNRYRLPTEAEWEYAARAGTHSAYSFGDDKNELSRYAWYDGNSGRTTHPVGQNSANPWGLHDVHGNVWEWVQDWYDEKYYADSPGTDPKGPANGSYRVFRGGGWDYDAEYCRAGGRNGRSPDDRGGRSPGVLGDSLGFRLTLSLRSSRTGTDTVNAWVSYSDPGKRKDKAVSKSPAPSPKIVGITAGKKLFKNILINYFNIK